VYVSSEQKEEHDVHYDVAFEEVGQESVVYHWPDREKDDKYVQSKNDGAIAKRLRYLGLV
jgi:hypothetical protein